MTDRLVENLPVPVAAHICDLLIGAVEGRANTEVDIAAIRTFRAIVLASMKADDEPVAVSSAVSFDGRAS